jgi:hypothetical protein
MRTIMAVTVGAAMLLPITARAGEVQLKLDDAAQNAVAQLPALLDQCVSGVAMRGDTSICRNVANFLVALGNEVKVQQAAVAKAAADEGTKKQEQGATDKAKASKH